MVKYWGHVVSEDQLNDVLVAEGKAVTTQRETQFWLHIDVMYRAMIIAKVPDPSPRRIVFDDGRRGWIFAFKVSNALYDDKLPEHVPRQSKEQVEQLRIALGKTKKPAWYRGYDFDPKLDSGPWLTFRGRNDSSIGDHDFPWAGSPSFTPPSLLVPTPNPLATPSQSTRNPPAIHPQSTRNPPAIHPQHPLPASPRTCDQKQRRAITPIQEEPPEHSAATPA
ncbi:hypothetical protein CONPUDRAFT_160111 [Coniophora puteana RWD-64-598 SS2]|uniref:Uncharacterized protein n=1 Tax=Coniophora puteana (strain RWD-64-598) TaxID=741705 RepID=R7SE03_CONPW|nr:uncharacterized protein CONPUDRAFT_160111 [Coniophora puteana RWD-64-598 SS2]EIW74401.1 hypothetical protein CONPUDRAFT_160111 [Coniophora puteana RWD-64-598 SS2]